MKRTLYVFLMLLLIIGTGCQLNTLGNRIEEIDGLLMVSAKEMSDLLGLTYIVEDEGIVFRQDNIDLRINFNSPYVKRDKYIMYILEKPVVTIDSKTYLPLSFFTDYLKAVDKTGDNNKRIVTNNNFSLYSVVKFLPDEVLGAITDQNYPYRDKILNAVELPRSMGIPTPKINMEKIVEITPLSEYNSVFKDELMEHGFSDEEIANLSYGDYQVIKNTWKLPVDMIGFVIRMYPELEKENISDWTYGDLENCLKVQEKLNYESGFSEEQKKLLSERGIQLEDVFYLFKEFHQIDVILAQSDEVLKNTIESYYQLSIAALQGRSMKYLQNSNIEELSDTTGDSTVETGS